MGEEAQSPTGGCMRRCYYRSSADAPKRRVDCNRINRYKGTRKCTRGGRTVPCSQLTCVNEVGIEKTEGRCKRICYYRPYAGARKRRIPCRHVDTKYVGDKKVRQQRPHRALLSAEML